MSPLLSVIVPTHNRAETLVRCLLGLSAQTAPFQHFEVIVVDDASTDNTASRVDELRSSLPYEMVYLGIKHSGPAAARNAGIGAARASLVLLIQDDIIPHRELIARHLDNHERYPEENVVVLGHTTWPPALRVTPLMRYLGRGPLVSFHLITDRHNVSPSFFYTGNISLKRSFVVGNGLFDESFPYASYEDTDLGYRLASRGMRMIYDEQAVGYHWHPMTLSSFIGRQRLAAYSMLIFKKKHPLVTAVARPLPRAYRNTWHRGVRRLIWPLAYGVAEALNHLPVTLPGTEHLFGRVLGWAFWFEVQRLVGHSDSLETSYDGQAMGGPPGNAPPGR